MPGYMYRPCDQHLYVEFTDANFGRPRGTPQRVLGGPESMRVVLNSSSSSAPIARVRGGFLYKLGVVSYTIRILVYPACILHVS